MGIGNTSKVCAPVRVNQTALGGAAVRAVSAGSYFSVLLTTSNELYAWGSNDQGQLGDGTTISRFFPTRVNQTGDLAGKTISSLVCGYSATAVVDSTGKVYMWGSNTGGILGRNSTSTFSASPGAVFSSGVLLGKLIVQISVGNDFVTAITATGDLVAWGSNSFGQLGAGVSAGRGSSIPILVPSQGALATVNVSSLVLSSATARTIAFTADGRLLGWGWGQSWNLGASSWLSHFVPINLTEANNFSVPGQPRLLNAGPDSTVVVTGDNEIYTWGSGFSRTENMKNMPANITMLPEHISSRQWKFINSDFLGLWLLLSTQGHMYGWGYNPDRLIPLDYGAIFYPRNISAESPFFNRLNISLLETGRSHAVAVANNGSMYCWGDIRAGECGTNGINNQINEPVLISELGSLGNRTIQILSCGQRFCLAYTTDNALFGWGGNSFGQLAVANLSSQRVPVPSNITFLLQSVARIALLEAEYATVYAITDAGDLFSWGYNGNGLLGDNSTLDRFYPSPVPRTGAFFGLFVTKVKSGGLHTMALTSSGRLFAWGGNSCV
jgi:alpha-tubulin suppressor-like RCC1 family protein